MNTYELIIDESKESGVDYIALVDRPAIESDWLAFNENKQRFQIQDEEKRIVSGYFMIADKPIYRNGNSVVGEDHNVVFSGDTIKQIQRKFMANNINLNTNIMHEEDLTLNDVLIFEHIIVDSERGMLPPKEFGIEADGSWFGSMYVPETKEKLWTAIKDGRLNGFSVEGIFKYKDGDEEKIKKVAEIYNSELSDESKLLEIKNLLKN